MIISARRERAMMKKKFVMGAIAGAAAGATAGILFAPRSGKETRKEIKDVMTNIKEEVMDQVNKMGHVTKSKYNKIVSAIVSSYQEAKRITPEQAQEIADILDESFSRIQEAAKKEMK